MTNSTLAGTRIAMLVANGFEEVHFTETQRRFAGTGAEVTVISPENGLVNGWHEGSWGHYFPIDKQLSDVLAADYTAIIIPGGQRSIDKLAANPHARRIVTGFVDAEKPVLAFGHAPNLLVAFERAAGTKVSAEAAVAESLTGAGATVSEEMTTLSGSLMTSTVVEEEPLREVLDQAIELISATGQVADAA
ncbi:MAG: DJ-1/PfpI family protein [Alphaproteobacteria bacterium]|nr:DJ-1/PfpI family protein [Alphaproteobacteria bacterium SS10]